MADLLDPVITAEIVAAKDKLVVQSNRAEVIVDGWEATGNLVADAPNDGQAYNRKYGQWALAESGGGVGDMVKVVYDPQGKEADAFARANHTGEQAIGTITGLSTSLASKVPEAPVDGKQYARKDAGWEEVVASGGGDGGVDYFTPTLVANDPFTAPVTVSDWKAIDIGNYTMDYIRDYLDIEARKYRGFPTGDGWVSSTLSTFFYTVQDDPSSAGDKIVYLTDKLGYGEYQLITKGQTGSAFPVWKAIVPKFADHPVPSIAIQELTNVESANPNTVGQVLTVLGANSVGFRDPAGGGGSTPSDLSISYTSSAAVIANSNGTGVTIASAASGQAGLLSSGNFYKLTTVGTGANKNVQVDWKQNSTSDDSYILNKPTLGTIARYDDVASSAINYVRTRAAWVDIATLGYIPEAPNDGKLYGRQGNAWVEIVLP